MYMDDDMERIWTMFDMDDVYGRCKHSGWTDV